MGVKYVKDEVVGWTPSVRRKKKSSRSEGSGSIGNLNVNNTRRSLRDRMVDEIPEIYLRKFERFEMGGSEIQPYCLEN